MKTIMTVMIAFIFGIAVARAADKPIWKIIEADNGQPVGIAWQVIRRGNDSGMVPVCSWVEHDHCDLQDVHRFIFDCSDHTYMNIDGDRQWRRAPPRSVAGIIYGEVCGGNQK